MKLKTKWIKIILEIVRYIAAILAGAIGGENSKELATIFNDVTEWFSILV